ncbi:MAG: hypothetical protein AB1598_08655 [Thermodesulfobacteriota bacterium]
METDNLDRSLLESKFERLISKSKDYINTRNEGELESLRNDLIHLKVKLETAIEKSRKKQNPNNVTALRLMLSIIQKLTYSVHLMENLKSKKPMCTDFDTKQMLDVLLPHIRILVENENWREKLDTKKLEEDYSYIESLEDQHKRVMLTYLIQDWHNIDEVINLLKIGELYKNIAEKLVSLSIISNVSNNGDKRLKTS